jgi:hypothetical protein
MMPEERAVCQKVLEGGFSHSLAFADLAGPAWPTKIFPLPIYP